MRVFPSLSSWLLDIKYAIKKYDQQILLILLEFPSLSHRGDSKILTEIKALMWRKNNQNYYAHPKLYAVVYDGKALPR